MFERFKQPERKPGLDLYSSPEGLAMANKLYESNKAKVEKLISMGLAQESELGSLRTIEENLKTLLPNGFSSTIALQQPLVGQNILKYNKEATDLIEEKGRGVDLDDLNRAA